ncbi:hypothetical protein ACEN19_00035 [Corynebacterium auriscanis]|uniref:glycine-rich domain-containing protein n=1 Tax=Corynebacterium auriscanis TaxID=99807 RepID=UPI003CEDA49E
MPNFSDAKQVMWGSKPVKEVRYGSTLVWPPPLKTWVADFETPGTHTITVPTGATHFYFWLSASGNGGQRGDGTLNRSGLGGQGGDVEAGYGGELTQKTGTVTIGKGGVEPNNWGEASTLELGLMQVTAEPNSELFITISDGWTRGYDEIRPTPQLLARVPHMLGDGKINTIDPKHRVSNGPGGKYTGGNGTPGVRGGGGSGGAGGFFGAWKPGGAGGDGFCRIVFTNQKIQTP